MFDGGTSMATPLVAGCCALTREYLIGQKHLPTPSAALVKAVLINGASDMPGQYTPTEAGPIPNFAEGFGRLDMQATIGPGAAQVVVLSSDVLSGHVTGQVVTVAGGMEGRVLHEK